MTCSLESQVRQESDSKADLNVQQISSKFMELRYHQLSHTTNWHCPSWSAVWNKKDFLQTKRWIPFVVWEVNPMLAVIFQGLLGFVCFLDRKTQDSNSNNTTAEFQTANEWMGTQPKSDFSKCFLNFRQLFSTKMACCCQIRKAAYWKWKARRITPQMSFFT